MIWVLSNYSSVDEVKEGLPQIRVTGELSEEHGESFVPPLHCLIVDRHEEVIVVEYVDGDLNIHDNPVGVITNSPSFD